jgi:hypothetical protein
MISGSDLIRTLSGQTSTLGRLDDGTSRPEVIPEEEASPREQPDVVVQWLAFALSQIQAAVSWIAYSRLARRWNARGRPFLYFNYAYAVGWAVILTVLIVLTAAWSAFAIAAATIASYRFLEIAVWYIKLLFDSGHRLILSPERNLLFLTIDSTAVVVIVGLWLAAVPGDGSSQVPEWKAALQTFTLNGTPDAFSGWQSDIAMVLGTLGGLLLIGAGLAVLVGLVSERFRYGPAESYTARCACRGRTRRWLKGAILD